MRKILLLSVSMLHFKFFAQNIPSKITIDFQQKGAIVQPSMYGIFFEANSNASDEGLYSEMILNCAFEDHTPPTGSVTLLNTNNRPSYNLSTHLLDEKASVIETICGSRQYAQAGYDQKTEEILLKIVNAKAMSFRRNWKLKIPKKTVG